MKPATAWTLQKISRIHFPARLSKSLYYAINHIIINKGTIDYRDNLTGKPFDYYLSEIKLASDSIESTSEWIDLYAQMLLNKRGSLKAQVGFNPANPMDIKFQYVVKDFMLSDLNIYSVSIWDSLSSTGICIINLKPAF